MGGRGYSSATSRRSGRFAIDVTKDEQVIKTGLSQKMALIEAAEQIADLDFEVGIYIAKDGTVYVKRGDAKETDMPDDMIHADGLSVREVIGLHNHPSEKSFDGFGGPFSDQDVYRQMYYREGDQYVSAPEGLYRLGAKMSRPYGMEDAADYFDGGGWDSQFMKDVNAKYREIAPGSRGAMKGANRLVAVHQTLIAKQEKYDYVYEFTPRRGRKNPY